MVLFWLLFNRTAFIYFDPFFHAGHYYVQEPASMFLEYILNALKIPKNCNVLDLCSAPGGKSTLLLSYFSEDAFIHCHEYDPHRAKVLNKIWNAGVQIIPM